MGKENRLNQEHVTAAAEQCAADQNAMLGASPEAARVIEEARAEEEV